MYSMWIALKKPPVTEKSVASFTDQREYQIGPQNKEDIGFDILAHRIIGQQGSLGLF